MSFMDPDQRERMAKDAMAQTEADKQARMRRISDNKGKGQFYVLNASGTIVGTSVAGDFDATLTAANAYAMNLASTKGGAWQVVQLVSTVQMKPYVEAH